MKSLKEIFQDYQQQGIALPAFNIDSFEIYQAVEAAVSQTSLPCIVQLSPGEDTYFQAEKLLLLVKKANSEGLPIYLNMDHGKDINRLLHLASLGFDMIHFDGSAQDYSSNLLLSRHLKEQLDSQNLSTLLEVEFNRIKPVGTQIDPAGFTSPSEALDFMTQTKANLLAVSIGNLHGVNLSTPEHLNLELLQKIFQTLNSSFLTLHGGSGIDSAQIKQAVSHGVVKININTDLRLQFKHSLADNLSRISSEKIYDYLSPLVTDIKEVVVQKLIQFSTP
jgi:fructose-bisphosphate aldolase class II